jgi:hypothetical protein
LDEWRELQPDDRQRLVCGPAFWRGIYKIYAESFEDQTRLNAILTEAEGTVNNALNFSKGRE